MTAKLHLIKLSVGSASVEGLADWQTMRRAQTGGAPPRHVTRMWPKREADLLQGGSIYWVIQGFIQCRQKILRLDEVIGEDGIRRCGIVLEDEITPTASVRKRPFQGWRYLQVSDAPPDLPKTRKGEDALPAELSAALADIGVI